MNQITNNFLKAHVTILFQKHRDFTKYVPGIRNFSNDNAMHFKYFRMQLLFQENTSKSILKSLDYLILPFPQPLLSFHQLVINNLLYGSKEISHLFIL